MNQEFAYLRLILGSLVAAASFMQSNRQRAWLVLYMQIHQTWKAPK